jgi:hypothetical protein
MSGLEIDRCRHVALQCIFPAGNAHTPSIAWLEPRESPFRPRCHEIVSIQHGKIEKLSGDVHTNRMQADVFGARPAIAVPVKSRHRIAAAALQLGSKDVGRHV